ncbi:MAG: energy transducer TonB [Bacteroidales bacterium]|nr:energy transducer TonB [Bacteroidales bacterium]
MALYGYESKAKFIGTMSAIGFALFAFVLCSYTNMSATVKPHDSEILVDMEPEEEPEIEPQKIEVAAGREPRTEEPQPKQPVKLVQKSEAQTVAKRPNVSPESTVGDKGDVEVPEPPREKEINKKALFSSAHNTDKDTLAQQVAEKVSDKLTSGHTAGNTTTGNPEGQPSARLEGRTTVGSLPVPSFTRGEGGKVVVKIYVNQDGKVTAAIPGAPGTTLNDSEIWASAKKAALGAHFNVSRTAPESQEGTITYIFRVR